MNIKRLRARKRRLINHRVYMYLRALDKYMDGKAPAEYVKLRADKLKAIRGW